MKVLITPDVEGWAIGNITNDIIKQNSQIEFKKVCIHPREIGASLLEIENLLKKEKIDLWHAQYWRSATQLMDIYPAVKDVPCILTHHNHYCFDKSDWKDFSALTSQTNWACERLKEKHSNVYHIPHGIDLERYKYIDELEEEGNVGYIGRVCPWKNLGEITKTSKKLGYKVIGSGYVDKVGYWEQIDKSNLEFNGGIGRTAMNSPYAKDALYERMTCFVMYSTEEKETGTLPLFEAMARGVPVLATNQGSARDIIKDGENGLIFDESNFESKLKEMMENKELRQKLRKNAWESVRHYSTEKMGRSHDRMYHEVIYPNKKIISVVIPTFNRADALMKCLLSVETSNYDAKEIIVCDDGSTDHTNAVINEARKQFKTNIKYYKTGKEGEYGLAKARNIGAIQSIGDTLMFLDDRYEIEKDVLDIVATNTIPQSFSFGNKVIKGKLANKKSFIENFSWINRNEFFQAGMFNERLTMYGGMSQEVRERFGRQGIGFNFVSKAVAKEIISTKSRSKKRNEIWKAKYLLYKMYG